MTNTTKQLITHLNSLRVLLGQKELKAWKESRIKLVAAITKLQPTFDPAISLDIAAPGIKSTPPEASNSEAADWEFEDKTNKKLVKKAKKSIARVAVKKVKPGKDANYITLADIAREIEITPKVARAKMRRTEDFNNIEVNKYQYKVEHKDQVIAYLKADNRKKS